MNQLEFNTATLFPPITIGEAHVNVSDEWISNVKDFCLDNGKESSHGNLITTFGSEVQPHQIDWIFEILGQMAPEQAFVNSWVQVYDVAGFHPPHNHAGQVDVRISGCLFLTEGSSTYFQDPLHPDRSTSKPDVKPGDILLWDPAIYHYSPPVKEERIILAFNLR